MVTNLWSEVLATVGILGALAALGAAMMSSSTAIQTRRWSDRDDLSGPRRRRSLFLRSWALAEGGACLPLPQRIQWSIEKLTHVCKCVGISDGWHRPDCYQSQCRAPSFDGGPFCVWAVLRGQLRWSVDHRFPTFLGLCPTPVALARNHLSTGWGSTRLHWWGGLTRQWNS